MTGLPEGISLFRREVVERRANVLYGTTLLPPPRLFAALTWCAVALVAAIITALLAARYTPHVVASGRLVHQPGDARINSPRAGTVARLFAADGATVEAGAPLVELRSDRPGSESDRVDDRVLDGLRAEADSLQRQRDTERALLESGLRAAQSELRVRGENLSRLEDLQSLARRRESMAEAARARMQELADRGLVPRSAVEAAESESLAARMAVRELEQRRGAEQSARLARRAQAETLPLLARQRLADLERQAAAVATRLAEAESQRAGILRAPIAGRLARTRVSVGESVTAGTELLTLVPLQARLQAELMLPTRAAGFVEAGMPVRIRYDAFPFQQFGQQPGTVLALDPAASESASPDGLPAYRVWIEIPSETITAADGPAPLRAGMTLQADILQQSRRVVDWLLDPLHALRAG